MWSFVVGAGLLSCAVKEPGRRSNPGLEPRCTARQEAQFVEAVRVAPGDIKFDMLVASMSSCRGGAPFRGWARLGDTQDMRAWIGDPEREPGLEVLCPGTEAGSLGRSDLPACRFEALGLDPQAALAFWASDGSPSEEKAALVVVYRTLLWMSMAEGPWKQRVEELLFLGHGYETGQGGAVPVEMELFRSSGDAWEQVVLPEIEEELKRCYWQSYVGVLERPVVELEVSFIPDQVRRVYGISGSEEVVGCVEALTQWDLSPKAGPKLLLTLQAR